MDEPTRSKRGPKAGYRGTPEQRFFAKVDKNGPVPAHCPELGPCWIWTAAASELGYGRFYWDGELWVASRFAYVYFVTAIPDDVEVRHRCDNPSCVNPAHLIPGTHLDNMQDMVERGRQWRKDWKQCGHGHDLTLPGTVLHQGFADRCRECCRERSYQKRVRERGGPPRPLKLSTEQVAEIRVKRAAGTELKVLAAEFGVSKSYLCEITKGRARRQDAASS